MHPARAAHFEPGQQTVYSKLFSALFFKIYIHFVCFCFVGAAAEYVLTLLSDRTLNQVDLQLVMDQTTNLVQQVVSAKLNEVVEALTEAPGENVDTAVIIADAVQSTTGLFSHVKNQKKQVKYFVQNYGMITPIVKILPERIEDFCRVRTGEDQTYRKKGLVYLSLLKQLEQSLNFPDVMDEIEKTKEHSREKLSFFEDGLNFSQIPLFQMLPNALQIHVYIDEVQMAKELGSKTKRNKLVYVYFCIANLPLKFRSVFKSINLLSVFPHSTLRQHGVNVLIRPVVDDLKLLERGVEMTIAGNRTTVRGTLTAVVADNLASHQIGGFKAGFAKGFRKCRFCLGTDEEIQTKFFDDEFSPRTRQGHDFQCSALEIQELRAHFSRLYGISEETILNELQFFHVIWGLPPDIMHDLLEGVIPNVICKLIIHCIRKKYFSLAELNHIIANFEYGHSEASDKPSPIDENQLKSKRLRQTAAQMWLLATCLPLMVGVRVSRRDSQWKCLTTLLEITRLVFLNSISNYELLQLDALVEEFLINYKESFQCRIIPKMHHLIHYSKMIRHFGPLTAYWCMRYEAKHKYFKKLQQKINNFINMPVTLSMRHQIWQCKEFLSARKIGGFLVPIISHPRGRKVPLLQLKCSGEIANYYELESPAGDVFVESLKWLRIGSIEYKKDISVIVCPLTGSVAAQFGIIVEIILYRGKFVFVCKLFRTRQFYPHLQSYRLAVRDDNFHMIICPLEMNDQYHVYIRHTPGFHRPANCKNMFIVTKTEVSSLLF